MTTNIKRNRQPIVKGQFWLAVYPRRKCYMGTTSYLCWAAIAVTAARLAAEYSGRGEPLALIAVTDEVGLGLMRAEVFVVYDERNPCPHG